MKILILVLSIVSTQAFAENRAIKELNYSATAGYASHKEYTSFDTSATLRTPLTNYIGGMVGLNNQSAQGVDENADSKASLYTAAVFIREPRLGGLSLLYLKGDQISDQSTGGLFDSNVNLESRSLNANYYFENVTLSAQRDITEVSDSSDRFRLNNAYYGLTYYITNNMAASITAGAMDAEDFASVNLVWQPATFKNSMNFGFRYSNSDVNSDLNHLFSLLLTYNFDTRVNLKTRQREY